MTTACEFAIYTRFSKGKTRPNACVDLVFRFFYSDSDAAAAASAAAVEVILTTHAAS